MKLFKKLFINPTIEKRMVLLEIERMELVNSMNSKMNLQQKAELFCKEKEIQFAINVLKEML